MVFLDETRKPISHAHGGFVSSEVSRDVVLPQRCLHGGSHRGCLRLPSKELKHHCRGKHRPDWIGDALAGDIRCGPMDWLKQGGLARMDVPRRCQAQAASKLCSQVADDVAEEVASDDDVELPRIANYFHRQRVDEKMARLDVLVFLADFLEDALP